MIESNLLARMQLKWYFFPYRMLLNMDVFRVISIVGNIALEHLRDILLPPMKRFEHFLQAHLQIKR